MHKCVVRAVACYPCHAKEMFSLIRSCEYKLKLTLEDPTARLHAYICSTEQVVLMCLHD